MPSIASYPSDGGGPCSPAPALAQPPRPTSPANPAPASGPPLKLDQTILRIAAAIKGGHLTQRKTQDQVSSIKDELVQLRGEVAHAVEVTSARVGTELGRELAKVETRLSAQLATNSQNLETQLNSTIQQLDTRFIAVGSSQVTALSQVAERVADRLDQVQADLVAEIQRNAEEERDQSREDLAKVGECFGSSLDQKMDHVFAQLDHHKAHTTNLVTKLESTIATARDALIDVHHTTASQMDSLVTASAALEPRLELIDRLRDVPLTEDVTTLHDLLANQLHQGQTHEWAKYEALARKVDELGGVGGPLESVIEQQKVIKRAVEQIGGPSAALARLERGTTTNAATLAELRAQADSLHSSAPAKLAAIIRDIVREELAHHAPTSPSSSAQTVNAPPPCTHASPPDRAALPPRRHTSSDTSSKTLVGPGPSQEAPAQQVPPGPAQLPSEHPTSSLGPRGMSTGWPAWMGAVMPADLSSDAMAMIDEYSQTTGWGAGPGGWGGTWAGANAQLPQGAIGAAAVVDTTPMQPPAAIVSELATEPTGLLPSAPAAAPAASPAVPSSAPVVALLAPNAEPTSAAAAAAADGPSSPQKWPKPKRKPTQSPSTLRTTARSEGSPEVLPSSRTSERVPSSAPSTPARQPLRPLAQAPAQTDSSRASAKRASTVLAPDSSDESQGAVQAPARPAKKARAAKPSAPVGAGVRAKEVAAGGGSGGGGVGGAGGMVTPASPAPSAVSVATTDASGSRACTDGDRVVGDGLKTSKVARRTYKKRVMRTIPQSDDEDDVVVVNRF